MYLIMAEEMSQVFEAFRGFVTLITAKTTETSVSHLKEQSCPGIFHFHVKHQNLLTRIPLNECI